MQIIKSNMAFNLKKPQTIIITTLVATALILGSAGAWWYFGHFESEVKTEQTSQSLTSNPKNLEAGNVANTTRAENEAKDLSYPNIPSLEAYNQNPKTISDFNIVGSCSPENAVTLADDTPCFVTDSALTPIIDFSIPTARDTFVTLEKGLKKPNSRYLILIQSTEFADVYTVFDFDFKTGLKSILNFSNPTQQASSLGFDEVDVECLSALSGTEAKACFQDEADFLRYLKIYNQDQLKIKNNLESLKPYLADSN